MSFTDRQEDALERARLSDFCPVRSEEAGLFRMEDGYIGRVFIAGAAPGASERTQATLETMLELDFPRGTMVQLQNWALPGALEAVRRFEEDRKNATTGHVIAQALDQQVADLFDTFRRRAPLENKRLTAARFLVLAIKIPADRDIDTNPDTLRGFESLIEQFREGLDACGLGFAGLDAQQYLHLMSHVFDPWTRLGPEYSEFRYIHEQLEVPGNRVLFKRRQGLHLRRTNERGEKVRTFINIVSVAKWPRRMSLALMNYLIGDPAGLQNQITVPHIVSTCIKYYDRSDGLAMVKGRARMVAFNSIGAALKWMPALGAKAEGFQILLKSIEGERKRTVGVATSVILIDRSRRELDSAKGKLLALYGSLGIVAGAETFVAFPSFTNHLPLWPSFSGTAALERHLTMGSDHAAQVLPIFGDWLGSTSPHQPGYLNGGLYLTRRGEPCTYNVFSPAHGNANFLVISPAGGGKSFAMQYMNENQLALGTRVWVIDVGRSYLKQAAALKGEFRAMSPDSNICLNPFSLVNLIEEDLPMLTAVLATMCDPSGAMFAGEMGSLYKSILGEGIRSQWTTYTNNLSVDHLYRYFNQQDNERSQVIGKTLFNFCRQGPYGRWFNGANNVQMDNPFTVIELEEIKSQPHLQAVVLQMIVLQISQTVYTQEDGRKMLLVDEALDLVKDPMMADFFASAYQKFRKYGASIGLVVQDLIQFSRTQVWDAVRANSYTTFLLDADSATVTKLQEESYFTLDDYGWNQMRELHTVKGRYSEMMIVTKKTGHGVVRILLPEYHKILFSTNDDERASIFSALKAGHDIHEVVMSRLRGVRPTPNVTSHRTTVGLKDDAPSVVLGAASLRGGVADIATAGSDRDDRLDSSPGGWDSRSSWFPPTAANVIAAEVAANPSGVLQTRLKTALRWSAGLTLVGLCAVGGAYVALALWMPPSDRVSTIAVMPQPSALPPPSPSAIGTPDAVPPASTTLVVPATPPREAKLQ